MWARVVEFMMGCWLTMSPFIFRHDADDVRLWAIDFVAGTLVMLFSLMSYWPPLQYAHWVTAVVALLLIVAGRYASGAPVPPAGQNYILVGLLLLMLAVVPNYASEPSSGWVDTGR